MSAQKWGWFAKRMLKMGEAFGMYTSNGRIAISQEIVRAMAQGIWCRRRFRAERRLRATEDSLHRHSEDVRPDAAPLHRHDGPPRSRKRQHDLIHAFPRPTAPKNW